MVGTDCILDARQTADCRHTPRVWVPDRQTISKHSDRQAYTLTDRQTGRQTVHSDQQTDTQTGQQTVQYIQTDRQRLRQTKKHYTQKTVHSENSTLTSGEGRVVGTWVRSVS